MAKAKRIGANKRKHMAERRLEKAAPKKKMPKAVVMLIKIAVLGGVFGAALGVGVPRLKAWAKTSDLFVVRHIEIETPPQIDRTEALEKAALKPGVSMFSIQADSIRSGLSGYAWAKNVRVQRRFPDKVRIVIDGREAVGMAHLDAVYCFDRDGAVLPIVPGADCDVPLFYGLLDTVRGKESGRYIVEEDLARAMAFVEHVRDVDSDLGKRISQVDFSERDKVSFMLFDLPTVLRIDSDRNTDQIEHLARLLAHLKREGMTVARVDLCHKNLAFVAPRGR